MTSAAGGREARIRRKLRGRLLPFLFVLYIVAFLDRINIGFAALTMNQELGITSRQFGLLAGIFFVGYFLFEIPSNLLLHKIGARVWIARILLTWGMVAVLTGLAHSVAQLYVLRFLLGVAEAGFFPGMILYLTYWFRQREQAQTLALFLTGLPVTSIVGAPLSGLILDHVHWLGISSWRWLLVLEGIPAVVCGVLTYFLLPSRPAEAKFLTAEEKEWLLGELQREEEQKRGAHPVSALQALTHGRVWHLAGTYFALMIGLYSMGFWMPQTVKALSGRYSNSVVGVLVMVPYLVGLLGMLLVSWSSDRRGERRYHTAIPVLAGGLALMLLGTTRSPFFSMALLALVIVGIYSFLGPFWSLPSEFLTGFSAASGIAFINSVGNLGGIAGPWAIGAISQTQWGVTGGFAAVGVSLFAGAGLVLLLPKDTPAPATG
ncbi:MAG: MFS transporter [Acidobacteriia bacterium]|nr:MFS transporter [Terriglobia bacterium]